MSDEYELMAARDARNIKSARVKEKLNSQLLSLNSKIYNACITDQNAVMVLHIEIDMCVDILRNLGYKVGNSYAAGYSLIEW